MNSFNQAQYDDLLTREQDLYANTKYDILLDYLADQPPLRILNAGCGSGELSLRLAARGHRVHGIDPEPEYVKLALRHAGAAGSGLATFEVASIEDFCSDDMFDGVIATDVLEHIADDRAALHKLVHLTRPGGLILLTVPAGQWLFGYHDEVLGHFRRYSRTSLSRLAREFCNISEMRYFGFTLIPVCLTYSKWLRRPYPVAQSGDSSQKPFLARVLRNLLRLDRRLPLPVGTSLILKGTRK